MEEYARGGGGRRGRHRTSFDQVYGMDRLTFWRGVINFEDRMMVINGSQYVPPRKAYTIKKTLIAGNKRLVA